MLSRLDMISVSNPYLSICVGIYSYAVVGRTYKYKVKLKLCLILKTNLIVMYIMYSIHASSMTQTVSENISSDGLLHFLVRNLLILVPEA